VQDIDAAPALPRRLDHRLERRLAGHVGFEGDAFAARLPRHRRRFLGGGEIIVDGQNLGALLHEPQNRGAAIAHSLARRLPGADLQSIDSIHCAAIARDPRFTRTATRLSEFI